MAHPSASLRTKPLRVHPKGTHHGSWSLGESTHVPGRVIADKFHEREEPPRVHGQLDSRERGEGHLFGGGIGARRARKGPSRHQRRRGTFRPLKKALREITGDGKFDHGSCFFSFLQKVVKSKCIKSPNLSTTSALAPTTKVVEHAEIKRFPGGLWGASFPSRAIHDSARAMRECADAVRR
jgi:hypothetical protein